MSIFNSLCSAIKRWRSRYRRVMIVDKGTKMEYLGLKKLGFDEKTKDFAANLRSTLRQKCGRIVRQR